MISTDTAFLIGALAIINPKFPARLRLFLLTLAVVDDIGALTVIALFYSDDIRIVPLLVCGGLHRRDRAGALPARRPRPRLRRRSDSRCGWRCPSAACTRRWQAWRSRC